VNLKSGLKNAEARIVPEDDDDDDDGPPPLIPDVDSNTSPAPGLGNVSDMLRGFGGGGAPGGGGPGAGGMPDMANLMNNPMMAQMAQQMMGDGGMARLMQNPSVLNMVWSDLRQ
jgi:small glutamine-rich tetratricopeptide repeat-containing protein alpha